jgi:predicted nucleic acid-binding protein
VTTEILLEYEEKINQFFAPSTAQLFLDALGLMPNVHKIELYYKFLLIKNDTDDDKFADCAIAAGVHYLVTDDKHFNTLLKLGFPKVNLINIKAFSEFLQQKSE